MTNQKDVIMVTISVWNDPWPPTIHPKPEKSNQHNLYPDLTMDSLINIASGTSNVQLTRNLVDLHDAKIIESIPLSRTEMDDKDGWHFTENKKYTVRSCYQVERVYPDREILVPEYGPPVTPLKAHSWKI